MSEQNSTPPEHARGDGVQRSEAQARLAEIMLHLCSHTEEEECACDEAYAMLDEFTERAARGEDVSECMPILRQHLEICTPCREEYEALLRVLESG
jgi:hypothetical protein